MQTPAASWYKYAIHVKPTLTHVTRTWLQEIIQYESSQFINYFMFVHAWMAHLQISIFDLRFTVIRRNCLNILQYLLLFKGTNVFSPDVSGLPCTAT